MELFIDSAEIKEIEYCLNHFTVAGVTTNPSIMGRTGNGSFFTHLREIRNLIGKNRLLFVQTTASDTEGMIKDAYAVLECIDDAVRIKIPSIEAGFAAMEKLTSDGVHVAATGVYTSFQGLLSIGACAEWLAPYCKRMDDLGIDYKKAIGAMRHDINESNGCTKILAASFRNSDQVVDALLAGAHAATVAPALIKEAFRAEYLDAMMQKFEADWSRTYNGSVAEQVNAE